MGVAYIYTHSIITRRVYHISVCVLNFSHNFDLFAADNSVSVEIDGLDPQKRELLEARIMGRHPGQVYIYLMRMHVYYKLLYM